MSSYVDEDELDIRVRRGGPSPGVYPEYRYVPRPTSGRQIPDYQARHVVPSLRNPPIYPARPIRRASTLPVRFDDEGIIARETLRRSRPIRLERGTDRAPSEVPQEFVDDYPNVNPDYEVVREREPARYSTRERKSRSRSPVYVQERVVTERDGRPSSSEDSDSETDREIERERIRRELRQLRAEKEYDSYLAGIPILEEDTYSFQLSRHIKKTSSRDSTLGSVSDTSEPDLAPTSQANAVFQQGKVLRVSRSRYTGDGSIGGLQSAELTILDNEVENSRKSSQEIFRWVQFHEPLMNLDRFENGCKNIPGLKDYQLAGISRIFARVRRKFDKPTQAPGGNKIRFMAPGVLQEPLSKDSQDKVSRSGTISWICLPYFCLEKYSGSVSGQSVSSHPMRTLLQARFSLTRKERDMQQAVCHLPGTPADNCFHIAQVWCLVLDDDVLITCSRAPIESLTGKSISLSKIAGTLKPVQNEKIRHNHILVANGKLLWSFPLEECQTWFAFLSHFWEYWPSKLEFSEGKIITPDMWPKIITRASKTTVCIKFNDRAITKAPAKGILIYADTTTSSQALDSEKPDTLLDKATNENPASDSASHPGIDKTSAAKDQGVPSDTVNPDEPSKLRPDAAKTDKRHDPSPGSSNDIRGRAGHIKNNEFHVFTWLNQRQPTSWSATVPSDNRHPSVKPGDPHIESIVSVDGASLKADLKEIDQFLKHGTGFEERLTFEGPTTGKFWGAIYTLLLSMAPQNPDLYQRKRGQSPRNMSEILSWLAFIMRSSQMFKDILSQANATEYSAIELPEELSKAWLYALMTLIWSTNEQRMADFEEQSAVCIQLLNEGMRKVIENLIQKSLLKYVVFKPWELASLINFRLLGDITSQSLDTSDTYFEYLSSLEAAVETNPLDRGHQDKISCFKQEISVILETLEQQRRIVNFAQPASASRTVEFVTSTQKRPQPYLMPSDPYESRKEAYSSRPFVSKNKETSSYRDRSAYNQGSAYRDLHTQESTYYENDVQRQHVPFYRASGPSIASATGSQIDPTDPNGIQGLLMQDNQALVDSKIREFQEMNIRASELETWNIQKIDYSKDRQEAAIYAFTIVTIIFLPLSTVAGILGMNTNDVRNMDFDQWVFWATALPLTVIILVLCLVWAGELENFWRGFTNLWSGGKGGGKYVPVAPGPQTAMMSTRVQEPPAPQPIIITNRIYNDEEGYDNEVRSPIPFAMDDLSIFVPSNLLYNQERMSRYKPDSFHPISLGDRLKDGGYKVCHKLGWGGFSTVWLAKDQTLERWVSIKIIGANSTTSKELEILQLLEQKGVSENIVRLQNHFTHRGPNGTHQCLVFELLGPNIDVVVEDYHMVGDPLEPEILLKMTRQLLQTVDALHKAGYAHGGSAILLSPPLHFLSIQLN
ncbi:hypothetical protein G7Y89_g9299 [Cudoniella acicularis]|uniref:non-specific serine/threonine protein kinase n=1 Tax=Cudoniella acicularis TaxID=354080 RepID=A0A8H4W2Q8_9HELO|nr:hypothetical protein G7Y89_g9299 [Cudoniella acicularis]